MKQEKETLQVRTDVDAPAWLLLAVDEVLHPVDVVEPQGHGGDQALQRDVDGQAKVLLQEGTGQRPHRLWLFEIHPGREEKGNQAHKTFPLTLRGERDNEVHKVIPRN